IKAMHLRCKCYGSLDYLKLYLEYTGCPKSQENLAEKHLFHYFGTGVVNFIHVFGNILYIIQCIIYKCEGDLVKSCVHGCSYDIGYHNALISHGLTQCSPL